MKCLLWGKVLPTSLPIVLLCTVSGENKNIERHKDRKMKSIIKRKIVDINISTDDPDI